MRKATEESVSEKHSIKESSFGKNERQFVFRTERFKMLFVKISLHVS